VDGLISFSLILSNSVKHSDDNDENDDNDSNDNNKDDDW